MSKVIQGVYLITNKINGKKYVGQSIDIYRRWYQHEREYHNTLINLAIKKYGISNFEFEIIEIVEDRSKLIDSEQHWISYYNTLSTNHRGYNVIHKDVIAKLYSTQIIQVNAVDMQTVNEFVSISEAARILGVNKSNISRSVKYLWKTKIEESFFYFIDTQNYEDSIAKIKQGISYQAPKPEKNTSLIFQATEYGEILKTYKNLTEASRHSKVNPASISRVINGKQKLAGGYSWFKDTI